MYCGALGNGFVLQIKGTYSELESLILSRPQGWDAVNCDTG